MAIKPQLAPVTMQMLLDQMERKGIMPSRYRGVGGKHRGTLHLGHGLGKGHPSCHQLAQPFDRDKGSMALVQMPELWGNPQGAEHSDCTDPQNDFLENPHLLVPAVEPGGQLAIPGRVLFDVGVHQVQGRPANTHMPDRRINLPLINWYCDQTPFPLRRERWHQWCVGPVEIFIHCLLAAIDREALVEVPLGIHKPNPDQRHPQVARFFAVVPSQNP